MEKHDKHDVITNGGKPARKRGPDGRFLPGDSGGPGRAKTKVGDDNKDLLELVEDLAREIASKSKDEKIKLKAGVVLLKVEGLRKPEDDTLKATPPHVVEALKRATNSSDILDVDIGLGPDEPASLNMAKLVKELGKKFGISKEEVLEAMAVVCPGCERLNQVKPKCVSRQDS